jgi:hypothetical protein
MKYLAVILVVVIMSPVVLALDASPAFSDYWASFGQQLPGTCIEASAPCLPGVNVCCTGVCRWCVTPNQANN